MRTIPSCAAPAAGRSAFFVAAALALAALVFLLAWWLGGPPPAAPAGTGPGTAKPPGVHAPAPLEGAAPVRPGPRPAAAGLETPAIPDDDPQRFRGRGRIRGELLAEGVDRPAQWTLVLEPHPWLAGAESAITRRIELRDGAHTFDERDLPLGGYRVRAETDAANSSEEAVMLVRGSADVFVTLVLRPAGLLDGFVRDARGGPAEGLEVVLERDDSRLRRTAIVDASGMYALRDVIDGQYRLYFGAPERPLLSVRELTFRAPSMRVPEAHLPETGNLLLAVHFAGGAPVDGAEVSGFGTPQGVARGRTTPDGKLFLRWLWPGRYRLQAIAPGGETGHATVVALPGETVEAELQVH